jgi:flagellar biogenesis protein FliO
MLPLVRPRLWMSAVLIVAGVLSPALAADMPLAPDPPGDLPGGAIEPAAAWSYPQTSSPEGYLTQRVSDGLVKPTSASLPLAPPTSESKSTEARRGPASALVTGAASLGIVLGLFLLVVWITRRGSPKSGGVLPGDVVEVLGRAPLVGRQQVHLVRCGTKLLLVCLSPAGAQTLTEITDPDEVERLLDICRPPKRGASLSQFFHPARDDEKFASAKSANSNA